MADHVIAHFKNDSGVARVRVGVREFKCLGAAAPFDHPHIFLDMGDDHEIICPYCSTVFEYASRLRADQTEPAGCLAYPDA